MPAGVVLLNVVRLDALTQLIEFDLQLGRQQAQGAGQLGAPVRAHPSG
jgi:hypothetical protein